MAYRKLGVKSAHRRAMLRNMTTSLLKEGQIETTVTRAKEVRSTNRKNDYPGQTRRFARPPSGLGIY